LRRSSRLVATAAEGGLTLSGLRAYGIKGRPV
jgi:hypothetical protein